MTDPGVTFGRQMSYRTRQEIVTDAIRQAILDGKLAPGQTLNQDELAGQLQTSRTPIREALHALAAESLVVLRPHQTAVVASLSSAEIDEVFAVRVILEREAARLASPRLTDDVVGRLRRLVAAMERKDVTPHDWLGLNEDFHRMIYGACGIQRLADLIVGERNSIRPYIATACFLLNRKASPEHAEILSACERRDGDAAAEHTVRHLRATQSVIRDWIAHGGVVGSTGE